MKRIIVHCERHATKVAMLDNGQLTDFFVQKKESRQTVGNIYKGRVVNVLPGMQAAFIDIGQAKNAFLYIDDLLPAHLEKQPPVKPSISSLVQVGQQIVVQVAKEAHGTKGARVTTHFSLPGRWIVYMPDADYVAISRKITNEEERLRLKTVAEQLRRPGEGLIVRTVAEGEPVQAIEQDLNDLREQWNHIRRMAEQAKAPEELYHDLDLVPRLIRDLFTDQVDEIIIDDSRTGTEIAEYVHRFLPHLADRVQIRRPEERLFERFQIDEQLDRLFRPKVWLDNGGYLMIDYTEALTVIDVNTGKYTGTDDLEQTVFETNLLAAEMIARLLRLRDLGGIIIVDFIDMDREEHREQVWQRLVELARMDRTKCNVVGWTKLGLLEITRKRIRENIAQEEAGICPYCNGSGKLPNRHDSY